MVVACWMRPASLYQQTSWPRRFFFLFFWVQKSLGKIQIASVRQGDESGWKWQRCATGSLARCNSFGDDRNSWLHRFGSKFGSVDVPIRFLHRFDLSISNKI